MMMSDTCPEITDDVGSGYLEPGAAVVPNVVSDESQGACGCCEDGMSPQVSRVMDLFAHLLNRQQYSIGNHNLKWKTLHARSDRLNYHTELVCEFLISGIDHVWSTAFFNMNLLLSSNQVVISCFVALFPP